MKNLDLNSMGVQEMNTLEMKETDGGFIIWLIAAAVVLIASSCQTQVTFQVGGANNHVDNGVQQADSTLNGNTVDVPIK